MKKLLLASVITAISLSAAHAAPTVYGKAFLVLDYTNADSDNTVTTTTTNVTDDLSDTKSEKNEGTAIDDTKLNSKSSRIGLKGSEPLNADTDIIYKLEYGIDIDSKDNGKGQFYSRDTYLGLANSQYGTVMAGRLTTIDDLVDFADVLEGNNVAKKAGPSFDEPRTDNTFQYLSPDFNGVNVFAMYGLEEDDDEGDKYGIGATYTAGPMNAGASYIGYDDVSHIRLSGNYAVSPDMTIGAMYQMSDYDTDDNENAIVVSGEWSTQTPWTAYAQVNYADNLEGASSDEALGIGVGGKYKFTKAATGHIYGGYLNTDKSVIDSTTDNVVVVTQGETDSFGIGAGLEYKF